MGLPGWFPPIAWETLHVALALDDGGRAKPRERRRAVALALLDHDLLRRLRHAGVTCSCTQQIDEALSLLASAPVDLVLVDPALTDALPFIKTIKAIPGAEPWGSLDEAIILREKHRRTPVVILPLPEEKEYAVLLTPPKLAWLENTEVLPLVDAIIRLDVDRLLGSRRKDPRPA